MTGVIRLLTVGVAIMVAVAPVPSRGANPLSADCANNEGTLVVVVGGDNQTRDLSLLQLRRIFLGEIVRIGGMRIVPVNQPAGTPDRTTFDRLVLRKSPTQAGRYWINRKIRGDGSPPRSVSSATVLRNIVANFPGAITYLRRDQLSDYVRTVRLEGKGPCDAGYQLAGTKR